MTMKEIAYRIEALQVEAEKIDSVQKAIFAAIYQQTCYAKEDYEWAFVAFSELTFDLKNELKELKDKAFESFRQGRRDSE